MLPRILGGQHWKKAAQESFAGQGSYGNGGAMRVAPVGAYFADNLELAAEQARLSAEITHAHPEGIAGAIAVAVAAAYAWRLDGPKPTRQQWIDLILPHIPISEVRSGIENARNLPSDLPVWPDVVGKIGNGSGISAQDTVPFVLWCAGERLDNYQEAIWLTASGGGRCGYYLRDGRRHCRVVWWRGRHPDRVDSPPRTPAGMGVGAGLKFQSGRQRPQLGARPANNWRAVTEA
ncbi:MAG TPA: ADP-ribosylglycohydrolase family protein [Phototrophicaceae bacterium]|nr:ADP-ribosylglycohydrolase family protein [Phototrophicaceae bacterium]